MVFRGGVEVFRLRQAGSEEAVEALGQARRDLVGDPDGAGGGKRVETDEGVPAGRQDIAVFNRVGFPGHAVEADDPVGVQGRAAAEHLQPEHAGGVGPAHQ